MGERYTQGQKDEVLSTLEGGLSAADASLRYSVSTHSIYNCLKVQTDNTGTSSLELSRLRRENTELKELIGELSLEKKRSKKIMVARSRMDTCDNKVALAERLGVARSSLYYQPKKPEEDEHTKALILEVLDDRHRGIGVLQESLV